MVIRFFFVFAVSPGIVCALLFRYRGGKVAFTFGSAALLAQSKWLKVIEVLRFRFGFRSVRVKVKVKVFYRFYQGFLPEL